MTRPVINIPVEKVIADATIIGDETGGGLDLQNPETLRVTITQANTEEAINLPTGTKAFLIQNVGARIVRYAYSENETADGGQYNSLYPFCPRGVTGINQSNVIIYVRSSGLETLEIDLWK